MENKRVIKRKRRKRNILILSASCLLIIMISALGYVYWQYKSALNVSLKDVGNHKKQDIKFNGVKDRFGHINVLLMGVDSRGEKNSRSDSIIFAQYNQDTNTPKIVSIMRDSYVKIPGHGMNKINAAEAIGGFELIRQTINENFEVDIQYYVQIDFKGFTKMIDKVFPDGLDVDIEKEMKETIGVTLSQGKQTLHGKEMLGYVRFRHDAEGDFGRIKRQQKVLGILADNMISVKGITHLPQMIGTIQPYIDTNVKQRLALSIASNYLKGGKRIKTFRIPIEQGFRNARVQIGNDTAAVLEIDAEKNRDALKAFLNN